MLIVQPPIGEEVYLYEKVSSFMFPLEETNLPFSIAVLEGWVLRLVFAFSKRIASLYKMDG